jgi:hypothetical protein
MFIKKFISLILLEKVHIIQVGKQIHIPTIFTKLTIQT